ncbi:hypothetical protein ACFHWW_23165 [Ensifer sp. P24N7]|uniref:hypothetical protein n=1 Tax=Sinorhizobium sp. P24N7 TaxID=3348358 RepID=UPI0035F2A737
MNQELTRSKFVSILKDGVSRTETFMAYLTEYHGAPTRTEYMLTADIARAFLDKYYEVSVEFLNRELVSSALTKRPDWNPRSHLAQSEPMSLSPKADSCPAP